MTRRTPHPIITQLATARTQRGISLEAVAARMAITKDAVWRWEVGEHDPRLGSVLAYAHALGYDVVLAPKKRGSR